MAELIVVICPHCQKQLKAPSDRIGRTAKCPQCQQSFTLGEGKAPTGSASGVAVAGMASGVGKMAAPPAPPAVKSAAAPVITVPVSTRWTLKIPSGETYGPIERTELDQWFNEGRINAECQLLNEGAANWQWASDVYPSLGGVATVPQVPIVAPQIGAAVSAGVSKGWHALGGFMDNVVGQVENAYASPQTTNFQAAGPQGSAQIGPLELQWQSVVAGLRVTKWSLLLGGAMMAVFGVFSFLMSFRDPFSPPNWFVRMVMTFVLACGYIALTAFFGNLIGWMVQCEIPARARTRKLLHLALGCFAVTFAVSLLLFMFGLMDSSNGFGRFIQGTIEYAFPVILLGGMGIYGCFLHTTNMFFGRRELHNLVIISFGLLAGTYAAYLIGTFLSRGTLNSIFSLLQALLLAASLGQLGLMSHHLKQVIQTQQKTG